MKISFRILHGAVARDLGAGFFFKYLNLNFNILGAVGNEELKIKLVWPYSILLYTLFAIT